MDIVSRKQAYLCVADEPRIQKPVVLKRKNTKRGRSSRIDRNSEDVDYSPNVEV